MQTLCLQAGLAWYDPCLVQICGVTMQGFLAFGCFAVP